MQKFYVYKGETYHSAYAVKKAIEAAERKRFWAEPKDATLEEKQSFWKEFNVEYREEPDPVPPEPTLEELKERKLSTLEKAFLRWYETDATVVSSLGFTADSDARSMMDVSGLVTTLEAMPAESRSTVAFMDSSNTPHMLTLDQVKTLQLEIIQNGQSAYTQKWTLRAAIESAEDKETLEGIEISFKAEDFSAKESLTLAKVGI